MSGIDTNNAIPFTEVDLKSLQDTFGIPQFGDVSGRFTVAWVVNGLIICAGLTEAIPAGSVSGNIPFPAKYRQSIISIIASESGNSTVNGGLAISPAALDYFQIANQGGTAKSYYWLAIGV